MVKVKDAAKDEVYGHQNGSNKESEDTAGRKGVLCIKEFFFHCGSSTGCSLNKNPSHHLNAS